MIKYLFYLLFLTIPFANISIAQHLYPVEIPLLILVFTLLGSAGGAGKRIGLLDALVVVYAAFSLVSVVSGADAIYESARHYRLMVLTPTILYLVIRFGPLSMESIRIGMYLMLPGILLQGILLTHYFILYGERPVGVEGAISTITASLLFAIGLGIMFFVYPKRPRGVWRLARIPLIIALLVFLVISSTRASMIGLLVFAPLAAYAWGSQRLTQRVAKAMMGVVVLVITLILTGTVLFSDAEIESGPEEASEIVRSTERLFSPDLYAKDLRDRMAFWGRMGKKALENPVLGSGAARATVGTTGGTVFYIGSAHNILITVLTTSGVLGLIIFVLMIWATYRALVTCARMPGTRDDIGRLILMSFSITLFVALTNDLSGGRVFIWFALMAIASRLSAEKIQVQEDVEQRKAEARILVSRKGSVGKQ